MSDSLILVTGGAGFIGSHLLETLLRAGQEVVSLDSFATGHRRNLVLRMVCRVRQQGQLGTQNLCLAVDLRTTPEESDQKPQKHQRQNINSRQGRHLNWRQTPQIRNGTENTTAPPSPNRCPHQTDQGGKPYSKRGFRLIG